MVSPLTRPIQDYGTVRRVSGADLTVSMGQSLGAIFSQPLETGMLYESFRRRAERSRIYTEEQREFLRRSERVRQAEIRRLESDLQLTTSEEEVANIQSRLQELQKEKEVQLSTALQKSIDAGQAIAPEDLSKKYGDLGLEFDRPMTANEAAMLADMKRAEITRNAIIGKGPQGVLPSVAKFGVSMAAVATDPIGLASMFIPVVSPARSAAMIARSGRIMGRARIGAVEGGVGTLAVEPLFYGLSQQAQLDYTMTDALFNVGVGTALGGAIGAAAGVLGRRSRGTGEAAEAAPGTPLPESGRVAPGGRGEAPRAPRPETTTPRRSAELDRDASATALRQFVNDDTVFVSRYLDGTDLRSTTALARIDGFGFQRTVDVPETDAAAMRPTYLVADEEGVIRTESKSEAETLAKEIEGEVVPFGDGYAIRKRAAGDVLRKPSGKPASFKLKSQAEKIVDRLRDEGDTADVVFRPEEADYVIFKDLSEEDLESLQYGESFEIPDGIDSKQLAVKANENDPVQKAIKGAVADMQMARGLVEDRKRLEEGSEEALASRELEEEAESIPEEQQMLEEEIARLEQELKDAGVMTRTEEELRELSVDGEPDTIKFQRMPVDPMFYSPVARAVERAKQQKMTGVQWLNVLKKSPGVKEVELEWTGLNTLLGHERFKNETFDRDQITQWLSTNVVPLQEVDLGEPMPGQMEFLAAEREIKDATDQLTSLYQERHGIADDELENFRYGLTNYIFGMGPHARGIIESYQLRQPGLSPAQLVNIKKDEEMRALLANARDAVQRRDEILSEGGTNFDEFVGPRFESHTEEGGENYRELALTVPDLETRGPNRGQRKEPFVEENHFYQPNIVVHARVKDRVGANGEKILFVEEIQSDLAKQWREGIESPEITARRNELNEQIYATANRRRDIENVMVDFLDVEQFPTVPLRRSLLPEEEWPESTKDIMLSIRHDNNLEIAYNDWVKAVREEENFRSELLQLGAERRMDPHTPATPFEGELAYQLMSKRLVQMAAQEGYDRISWTPGYMQAERWGKPVYDGIQIQRRSDGLIEVGMEIPTGDIVDRLFVTQEGVVHGTDGSPATRDLQDKNINDIFGAEVANQIMDSQTNKISLNRFFFDQGYKIAYDQQVKRAVDKLVKRYDARVYVDKTLPDFREVDMLREDADRPVWSVDINPKLREAASRPQPMFQTPMPGAMHVRPEVAKEALPILRQELVDLGLRDVRLQMRTPEEGWQGAFVGNRYGPVDILIGHSLDPMKTLHHEAIHAMKWMDLFRENEWGILAERAEGEWLSKYDIEERYPDLNREQQIEEAIAEAFSEYATLRTRPEGAMMKLWHKVELLFAAIRTAFKGKRAEDIFNDAYSGRVGRRSDTTARKTVFHASPHDFENFSTEAIGTGEGAQAFGWGLYFAENPEVAGSYARTFEETRGRATQYEARVPNDTRVAVWDAPFRKSNNEVVSRVKTALENEKLDLEARINRPGEDKGRVSMELNALNDVLEAANSRSATFEDVYRKLDRYIFMSKDHLTSKMSTSLWLRDNANVVGHKFQDQFSRDKRFGKTYNYVVYDDSHVNINVQRQEQPVPEDLLSPDTRQGLNEIPEVVAKFDSWKRAIDAAASCVGMRA